jgi:5-methylcytosine-specific restriction enzyme subunit McrC
VGDAKYKRSYSGGQNPDLYQLLAYTVAAGLPSGVLIYAKGEEEPAVHTVVHSGKQLKVFALDLSVSPDGVLNQIQRIAGDIQAEAFVRDRKLGTR